MWPFWLMSLGIGWHSINIGLIIDIIVILLIISITIYETRKNNKENGWKDAKYIDGKIWIDEQKWFIIETNVKKNIEKYRKIKWSIRWFFSIGSLVLINLFMTCFSLFQIRDSSHEIVNGNTNAKVIVLLVVSLIFLSLCIYIFTIINKILALNKRDKFSYHFMKLSTIMFAFSIIFFIWRCFPYSEDKNLELNGWLPTFTKLLISLLLILLVTYYLSHHVAQIDLSKKTDNKSPDKITKKIRFQSIMPFPGIFIPIFIVVLWRFGSRYICDKFKLWTGISSLIQLFCIFLSMILWLLFSIYIIRCLDLPRKDSNKKMIGNEQFNNTIDDNEIIKEEKSLDKKTTYDELIDNNKKLEEETWFHQWPLLK